MGIVPHRLALAIDDLPVVGVTALGEAHRHIGMVEQRKRGMQLSRLRRSDGIAAFINAQRDSHLRRGRLCDGSRRSPSMPEQHCAERSYNPHCVFLNLSFHVSLLHCLTEEPSVTLVPGIHRNEFRGPLLTNRVAHPIIQQAMSSSTDKITVPMLAQKKSKREKIVMVTAYDYPLARLADDAGLDITLVGDSLGMAELGFETTLPVTMEIMLHHVRAVRRGTRRALLLADMPFLSYQVNPDEAVRNAGRLLQEGGAEAVKLEGGAFIAPTIRRIVDAGIPAMAHLGFTPQSVHQIGVRVQGKDEAGAQKLLDDAKAVQDAGAFAVVLELVPPGLAAQITEAISIPTIGIGAGPDCDGQVLVINDLLALQAGGKTPFRHVKEYAHIGDDILSALQAYGREVREGVFPQRR